MLDCDNPFWKFSLAVYAAPGVAAECLALQSGLNTDVNMLLFIAWLGRAHGMALSDDLLTALDTHIQIWRDTAVRPLRAIRQNIKRLPAMADGSVQDLRSQIAGLELRAEQIEQAMLFALSRELSGDSGMTLGMTAAEAVHHNVTALLERNFSAVAAAGAEPPQAGRLMAETIAYRPADSQ
jgi:uncharacterized protein (TIGR02444 family)